MSMNTNRGLTLIEVLVTLVILMLGLLGLSGLIIKASKLNYEAYQRQQALAVASDMAERLRANQLPPSPDNTPVNLATAGIYAKFAALGFTLGDPALAPRWKGLVTGSVPNCAALASCAPAQIASYDLALWEGQLLGTGKRSTSSTGNAGVGGISNARGCIEEVLLPGGKLSNNVDAPANTFRITVAWQGDQPVPVSTTQDADLRPVATCGQGLYMTHDHILDTKDEYRRLVVLYQVIS